MSKAEKDKKGGYTSKAQNAHKMLTKYQNIIIQQKVTVYKYEMPEKKGSEQNCSLLQKRQVNPQPTKYSQSFPLLINITNEVTAAN